MAARYSTYFDNLFLTLRMARPEYKTQAQYSLRACREAELGQEFIPLLAELEAAITNFDENLADRGQSTAAGTEAYHAARTEWLEFVDDTMKDYVTPKLRKKASYVDFKKFSKSKLDALDQADLLPQAKALVALYTTHQAELYPTLAADAQQKYDAIVAADTERDTQEASIGAAALDLADDRAAIARAQRRLKAQLELTFDSPKKVYSFFDFSKARGNKKEKAEPTMPAA
jgi:hypothetical protein